MWNGARVGIRLYHLLLVLISFILYQPFSFALRARRRPCYAPSRIHMHGLVFNDELQPLMLMVTMKRRKWTEKDVEITRTLRRRRRRWVQQQKLVPVSLLDALYEAVDSYGVFDTFQLQLMVTDNVRSLFYARTMCSKNFLRSRYDVRIRKSEP